MKNFVFGILIVALLQACGSYKQNIMFQPQEGDSLSVVTNTDKTMRNYVIQPNDLLDLEVFTKKGEFLIDPEFKLLEEQRISNNTNIRPDLKYLVQNDGSVVLPMVGQLSLGGLTLLEAENKLIEAYATYYKDPFVKLTYVNKRVVVLGGTGGAVIPIQNENTRVTEVLAMVEGFEQESKAQNIRLLRDEKAYVLDFSSISGYRENDMIVENGDIIYVEPVRRPFTEFIRDNGPVISVLSSLVSLVAVLISIR